MTDAERLEQYLRETLANFPMKPSVLSLPDTMPAEDRAVAEKVAKDLGIGIEWRSRESSIKYVMLALHEGLAVRKAQASRDASVAVHIPMYSDTMADYEIEAVRRVAQETGVLVVDFDRGRALHPSLN